MYSREIHFYHFFTLPMGLMHLGELKMNVDLKQTCHIIYVIKDRWNVGIIFICIMCHIIKLDKFRRKNNLDKISSKSKPDDYVYLYY